MQELRPETGNQVVGPATEIALSDPRGSAVFGWMVPTARAVPVLRDLRDLPVRSTLEATGAYRCEWCSTYLEDAEVRRVPFAGGSVARALAACPHCGLVVHREISRVVVPLVPALLGAFRFPFAPNVAWMVLALAITAALTSFLPLVGTPILGGMVLSYLFAIVVTTKQGKEDGPWWMDFADVWDFLRPYLKFVTVLVVALVPLGLTMLAFDGPLGYAGLVFAFFYAPGALMIAAEEGGVFRGLDPRPVVRIFLRIPGPYLLLVGLGAVVLPLAALVLHLENQLLLIGIAVPFLWPILSVPVILYFPMVYARMLGIVLREHAYELS